MLYYVIPVSQSFSTVTAYTVITDLKMRSGKLNPSLGYLATQTSLKLVPYTVVYYTCKCSEKTSPLSSWVRRRSNVLSCKMVVRNFWRFLRGVFGGNISITWGENFLSIFVKFFTNVSYFGSINMCMMGHQYSKGIIYTCFRL